MRGWIAAALLAAMIAAWMHGHASGARAADRRHAEARAEAQAARLADAERLAATERARLHEEGRARMMALALEDEADAQAASHDACLPVERVRRLALR